MNAVPTDDELLASDEPEDFALFYRRHLDWVLGYLQRRTGDAELAADLCAEVFATALLARSRYKPRDGHANSWLFSIAHNKLTDTWRRGQAEQRAAVTERVLHGRTYPEMAAREGVSEAVMRKRVSRGLAAMRARIGGRG